MNTIYRFFIWLFTQPDRCRTCGKPAPEKYSESYLGRHFHCKCGAITYTEGSL